MTLKKSDRLLTTHFLDATIAGRRPFPLHVVISLIIYIIMHNQNPHILVTERSSW